MSTVNFTDTARSQWLQRIAMIGSFLIPGAVAYAMMYYFACNLPVIDDYHAILDFSLHFLSLPTFKEKLLYFIAAQHNDYKLMTQQAVVLAQLRLTHHINFSVLILIGNLLLLPILFILWKISFQHEEPLRRRLALFLPVPWIFFGLNYAETVNFAISGLQIQAVILFSLLALYLLAESTNQTGWLHFVMAMLAAVFACLTYANAFLLAPVGLMALIPRRAYLKSVIWCGTFVVPLAPFLYRYHSSSHFAWKSLPIAPLFFLSFLGSGIPMIPLGVALGLVIVVTYSLALRHRYDLSNPAAFLTASWILLTGALVTLGRVGSGFRVSHSSRYRLYSDILMILCYVYLTPRVAQSALSLRKKHLVYRSALAAAILFGAAGDVYGWISMTQRRQDLIYGLAQYRADPELYSPMYFSSPFNARGMATPTAEARITMNSAIATGIYIPPALPLR